MGYDITYHPIRESEILSCFFGARDDPPLRKAMFERFSLTEDDRANLTLLLDSKAEGDVFNSARLRSR